MRLQLYRLLTLCALLTGIVGIANAQSISSCGTTISSGGTYTLSSDISTSSNSVPCITVTGLTGTSAVIISCGGHSITNTSSANANFLLYAYSNASTSSLKWTGCKFNAPNVGATSLGFDWVYVVNTPTTADDSTNTYTNTQVYVTCSSTGTSSPVISLRNATYTNSVIFISGCYPTVSNNTMGGYTYVSAAGTNLVAIAFVGSSYASATLNTITGYVDGSGNPRMDDGITFSWDGTNTLYYDGAVSNTISHFFDLCVEFVGPSIYSSVGSNACTDTQNGIMGEYYYTSFDHASVENNTLDITGGSGTEMINIRNLTMTPFSSYFTNNYFYNNTVSGNTTLNDGSFFGDGAAQTFAAYSGNWVGSNNLGTAAEFIGGAGGVTDGGRNTCTNAFPSGIITCR